ncbi:MAG: cell division protein ZapA [Bacteroidales bacterium]|nr:cell division protein ZapA [Bacteroidales bacterium]
MNDEFEIQLKIFGIKYPLRISRKDEEIARKAAELVEKKYALYVKTYDVKETKRLGQDLKFLVAFEFALESLKTQKDDMMPFVDKIDELNEELADYLKIRTNQ